MDRRFQGYTALQFAESGHLRLGFDGVERDYDGPLLWFTPPGPRIRYFALAGHVWNHHYMAVRGPLVEAWVGEGLCSARAIPCDAPSAAEIKRELTAIRRGATTARGAEKLEKINRFENLLLKIRRIDGEPAAPCPILSALEATFPHADYPALAGRMGISPSTLRRRFHRRHGESIHRCVQRLRVERAKELLLESPGRRMADIAEDCGYCDEFYFSRHFKALVGLSPREFRDSGLEMGSEG
ncbi:MAG: helix-turn-helix domain-containing protein [Puniceicoccaceae bacterium]